MCGFFQWSTIGELEQQTFLQSHKEKNKHKTSLAIYKEPLTFDLHNDWDRILAKLVLQTMQQTYRSDLPKLADTPPKSHTVLYALLQQRDGNCWKISFLLHCQSLAICLKLLLSFTLAAPLPFSLHQRNFFLEFLSQKSWPEICLILLDHSKKPSHRHYLWLLT